MIEQTKNLFKFLKAFNKLKIKPISRLDSFEKVIWLCDIPNKKGCKTVIQNSHFENVQFETLLKIEKPEIKFFPAPPKNIVPWLKDSTLHSYRTQPQIFSYILKSSDNHLSLQGEDEKIYLTDHPEIKSEFDNYIDQEWTPWAKREKELEPVKEMYSTLFSIYKKQETQGEVYQVVLGLGLLCSKEANLLKGILLNVLFLFNLNHQMEPYLSI